MDHSVEPNLQTQIQPVTTLNRRMVHVIHWPISVTQKRTDNSLRHIFSNTPIAAHLKDISLNIFTNLNNINRVIYVKEGTI